MQFVSFFTSNKKTAFLLLFKLPFLLLSFSGNVFDAHASIAISNVLNLRSENRPVQLCFFTFRRKVFFVFVMSHSFPPLFLLI